MLASSCRIGEESPCSIQVPIDFHRFANRKTLFSGSQLCIVAKKTTGIQKWSYVSLFGNSNI